MKRLKKINRTERIELRCTEEEKKTLTRYAKKEKTTVSNYILSRAIVDSENGKWVKNLIADEIVILNAMNEIYHLVVKTGDEKLKAQVKELMNQMEVNKIGKTF